MSNWPESNVLKEAEAPREASGRAAAIPAASANPLERLFQSALERQPTGALLFDSKHNLVLCNQAARSILELPDYLFAFGTPSLEQMLRFNANRTESGPEEVDAQVKERMRQMIQREPHRFRLMKPNGKTIEVVGTPLEFGGYLMSYAEIERTPLPTEKRPESGLNSIYGTALQWSLFHRQGNALLQQASTRTISTLHFIDVDDYKGIFQRYGEQGATILVQTLVQRIGQLLSATDKLAYLGEDEFAILRYDIREAARPGQFETQLAAISKTPFSVGNVQLTAEFSVGTAMAPREGTDIDTLLLSARNSMRKHRKESPPQRLLERSLSAAAPAEAISRSDRSKSELRQQRRVNCNIRCRCSTSKGTFWGCVVDISRSGYGMTMDPTLSLVPGFRITIENGPLVGATGTVSWATWGSCGVRLDGTVTILRQVDAIIDSNSN